VIYCLIVPQAGAQEVLTVSCYSISIFHLFIYYFYLLSLICLCFNFDLFFFFCAALFFYSLPFHFLSNYSYFLFLPIYTLIFLILGISTLPFFYLFHVFNALIYHSHYLSGTSTYTVFAPTDAAFNHLSTEEINKMVSEKTTAEALVNKHIVPNTIYTAGMRFYQVKDSLAEGKPITVQKSGGKIWHFFEGQVHKSNLIYIIFRKNQNQRRLYCHIQHSSNKWCHTSNGCTTLSYTQHSQPQSKIVYSL
jgi:hypothetical protein